MTRANEHFWLNEKGYEKKNLSKQKIDLTFVNTPVNA